MALHSIGLRLEPAWHKLQSTPLFKRASANPLVSSASAIVATVAFLVARRDYNKFLAYGPAGVPYNIFGWAVSTFLLRIVSRETLSTRVYTDPGYLDCDEESFVEPVSGAETFPPPRKDGRPKLGSHPAPQRQVDQLPSEDVKKKFLEKFWEVAKEAEEKELVEIKQSALEGHGQGLFVSPEQKRIGSQMAMGYHTMSEFCHVHPDGSMHLILDRLDCKRVIETGWGQRHPLSGVNLVKRLTGFYLPVTYIMVYAPRNQEEIEVVLRIVRASIQFMTAGTRGALQKTRPRGGSIRS